MKLSLALHHKQILSLMEKVRESSLFFSMSYLDSEGNPQVTAIGSFFLLDETKGFYFEIFSQGLRKSSLQNRKVTVLGVNTGKWFWLRSLFRGQFATLPGFKLHGELGERRKSTEEERQLFQNVIAPLRWLRGYDLLWGHLEYVREIEIKSVSPLVIGKMTQECLQDWKQEENLSES